MSAARPQIGLFCYFPLSFGGGERYLLTAAEALREVGDVEVLCPTPAELSSFEERFGLDLAGVRFVHWPWKRFKAARDWFHRGRYDLFLALDNHLAPMQLSLGRRGLLHIQTPPYPAPFDRPRRNRIKLRTYDRIVVNSEYTAGHVRRHDTAGLPIEVLHPPIETALYRAGEKGRAILSVGRFFTGRHQKNHPLMIEAFRALVASGVDDVELWLAGSIRHYEDEHRAYLDGLREQAGELPVKFFVDASLEEVRRLYAEASVYWHATGYGVDEAANPQFLEHFGMAIAEAMAAEAIPVVYGRGGPIEIVRPGVDGEAWATPEELVERTRSLLAASPEQLAGRRRRCRERAEDFSKPRFVRELRRLAAELLES